MKTTKTIILFFFLSMTLHSQWQKTDYGYVSADSTYGIIKYDSDFETLVFESNKSMSVFDLNEGKIVNQKIIDNPQDSHTVTTYDLKYQYQIFTKLSAPGIHNGKGIQVIKIFKKEDNKIVDTILDTLQYEYDGRGLRGAVSLNYKLVKDSLLVISMKMIEYWEDEIESYLTFVYNLESKTYKKIAGNFYSYKDFSSRTDMMFIVDATYVRAFNPDKYYSFGYYNFYKLDENQSKSFDSDKLNLRNIALPNNSNKFVIFNENGYFIESFDNDDRIEQKTSEYQKMDAKFSDYDDFLILHDNSNNNNIFHIFNYEKNKILKSIQIDYNLKINFIKQKDSFIYCRREDGKILKIYIPFFDTDNLIGDFLTDKNIYFTGEEIDFYDNSAGYPDNWVWSFGDGKNSIVQNPKHIFNSPGFYTISLIVENEKGSKDTIIRKDYLQIISNLAADFDYSILTEDPYRVQCNNKSQGNIVRYLWNFGDGNLSNEENPQHTYNAGKFDITLTVFDEYGNFDQKILFEEFDSSIKNPSNLPDFDFSAFTQLQIPTNANLTDVEFFNHNIGMIVSDSGEIYTTIDGGLSWVQSEFAKRFKPNRLRFLSNGDAIIVGDSGTYIKSFDYGKNWSENTSIDTIRNIIDFDCISPFDCELLTDINLVLRTNNKLEVNTQNEFKMVFSSIDYNHIDVSEALKSIIANGESYLVGTNSIYLEGRYLDGEYLLPLFKTTDFKGYRSMTYHNVTSKSAGVIMELDRIDSLNIIFATNYNKLNYLSPNESDPTYEIITTNAKFDKFYSSLNQIVLPLSDGNLVYIDSMVYNNSGFNSRKTTIKLDNSRLYDYHQITPTKGIAIGESGKYYITDFTTDFKTQTTTPEIDIYPNPITEMVNIRFSKIMHVESVEIYAMTGNLIESVDYNQYTSNTVQKTENLTTGIYFVKIITSNGVFHKKIVKF